MGLPWAIVDAFITLVSAFSRVPLAAASRAVEGGAQLGLGQGFTLALVRDATLWKGAVQLVPRCHFSRHKVGALPQTG